jgi:hypothetical protein
MNKLKWKQKWCDDKSGCWYSAKVPYLNWEYIVEVIDYHKDVIKYKTFVFYSEFDDDCAHITKKEYKKLEAAMNACEKHLEKMSNKFKAWLGES